MQEAHQKERSYLYTFRKCSSLASLERLFDKFNHEIEDLEALAKMRAAASHRRAEILSGKFFGEGEVHPSVLTYHS